MVDCLKICQLCSPENATPLKIGLSSEVKNILGSFDDSWKEAFNCDETFLIVEALSSFIESHKAPVTKGQVEAFTHESLLVEHKVFTVLDNNFLLLFVFMGLILWPWS